MRSFVVDIIPKIQRFSQKLDDLTKLTNQHWVSISDISDIKKVYIFRKNNQLLISENGHVRKGSWELLGNQSLLIETYEGSYLLKHGFFDENVLALKIDSSEGFAFFVNESKFDKEVNNINDVIDFLTFKYLRDIPNEGSSSARVPKKDELGNIVVPKYSEGEFIEHFQLFESNFFTSVVTFKDGITGTLCKRKSDNQYYYFDSRLGFRYFVDKHSCIREMYIDKIQGY